MLSAIAPFGRPTHAPARIQMLIAILVPFAGGVPPWSVRGSSSPLGRQSLKTIAAPWSRTIDGPSGICARIAPDCPSGLARHRRGAGGATFATSLERTAPTPGRGSNLHVLHVCEPR